MTNKKLPQMTPSASSEYNIGKSVDYQNETIQKMMLFGTTHRIMSFLILSGNTQVLYQDEKSEKLITSLGWSHSFGEASYTANVMRTATVKVPFNSKPLRVIVLNQEQVASAIRFYPLLHAKLNHNISKILALMLSYKNDVMYAE